MADLRGVNLIKFWATIMIFQSLNDWRESFIEWVKSGEFLIEHDFLAWTIN